MTAMMMITMTTTTQMGVVYRSHGVDDPSAAKFDVVSGARWSTDGVVAPRLSGSGDVF